MNKNALPAVRTICYLLLCSAYLQGGIDKALDFAAARGEMTHFGLNPPGVFALAVIALELVGSAAIVLGFWRSTAALLLAAFTFAASMLANQFWTVPVEARIPVMNGFFEHLGLVGGFVFVAWEERQRRRAGDRVGPNGAMRAPTPLPNATL